ncbi:COG1361 S-layer family protein [Methanosarcina hadiensis]|uniref:COG1361 S-layer family protein n=1 Tax=Methanosarcina hadiensis TaxID=3078083 RepID=UPI00397798EC
MDDKQFISFIFIILLSLLLCSGTALGAGTINSSSLDKGISIDLLNQDPDPVKPGDVLEVRISVENTGYNDIDNCFVKIEPEYPFKILSEENPVMNIGTLGKRSENDRRKVLKFRVGVENDVNEGSYPLKVYLYSTDKKNKISLKRELTIDVDSESNAEIEYISVEKMIPGEKTNLVFGIKNVGNSPLKNSMFSWECSNDVILPVGSSNVKHINLIDVGETANVSFNVLTNVNTKPGLYKLDLTLTYDDIEELQTITEAGYVENEKRKTIKSKAGIYIGGTTDFDIAFMEQSPTGAYTFSVSNIGNNGANSVKVSIPVQENWTVTDGSNSVVLGNLAKGDYTIADFNLKPATVGQELPIKFEISYTSSDGIRQVDENMIPLYASPSIKQTGSKLTEESNESSMLPYKLLFLLLLGAAGVFLYKRYQKKVMEKNAEADPTGESQIDEKKTGE